MKLTYGVGICDRGKHHAYINRVATKGYKTWKGMLERCYSAKLHERRPTYVGCSVHEEFHSFQRFMDWAVKQKGFETGHLDKDLLVKGNKEYGPDTCVFLPSEVNLALVSHKSRRGEYPVGVYKDRDKFKSSITIDGEVVHLGYVDTPEEAHRLYGIAKRLHMKVLALRYMEVLDLKAHQALKNFTVEITD